MMLNTKKRPLIAAALLLTSFGITTSCIDNSYDLNKDIDMTISAGGEHLAIPVGYTEKITLDKIIELDEGDDLQIVDGEYHLILMRRIHRWELLRLQSPRILLMRLRYWFPEPQLVYQMHNQKAKLTPKLTTWTKPS